MRHGRRDKNHAAIRDQLRKVPGVSVADTGDVGGGFPDLVVGYRNRNWLVEVKDGSKPPSQRKLTPDQFSFFENWQGQVAKVNSLDEALELIGLAKKILEQDDE